MTRQPASLRTILRSSIKTTRFVVALGAILTGILLLVFMLGIFSNLGHEVPEVNYAEINARGIGTTATITGIETQTNIAINDQHPSIISYKYVVNDMEVESKFKTLSPEQVKLMHVGDQIPIRHMDGKSIITTLEPFSFPYLLFLLIPAVIILVGVISVAIHIYKAAQ